jgi:hypothetical protein
LHVASEAFFSPALAVSPMTRDAPLDSAATSQGAQDTLYCSEMGCQHASEKAHSQAISLRVFHFFSNQQTNERRAYRGSRARSRCTSARSFQLSERPTTGRAHVCTSVAAVLRLLSVSSECLASEFTTRPIPLRLSSSTVIKDVFKRERTFNSAVRMAIFGSSPPGNGSSHCLIRSSELLCIIDSCSTGLEKIQQRNIRRAYFPSMCPTS